MGDSYGNHCVFENSKLLQEQDLMRKVVDPIVLAGKNK